MPSSTKDFVTHPFGSFLINAIDHVHIDNNDKSGIHDNYENYSDNGGEKIMEHLLLTFIIYFRIENN